MLSLKRCREVLTDEHAFSDEELLKLRNELYSLAEVVVTAADAHSSEGYDSRSRDEYQRRRDPVGKRLSRSSQE